jgi:hypothetical protein
VASELVSGSQPLSSEPHSAAVSFDHRTLRAFAISLLRRCRRKGVFSWFWLGASLSTWQVPLTINLRNNLPCTATAVTEDEHAAFAALFTAIDARCLYPGNYAGEAGCPSRGHVACFLSPSRIAIGCVVLEARETRDLIYIGHNEIGVQKGHISVALVLPNWIPPIPRSHLECMAGTTGLEPATSAVTAHR